MTEIEYRPRIVIWVKTPHGNYTYYEGMDGNCADLTYRLTGASYNQIAAELGRHRNSIRSRAKALGIVKVPVRPGPGASHIIDAAVASALATVCATHCRRCGVLLTRAPAGHDDVCGWCEREATS